MNNCWLCARFFAQVMKDVQILLFIIAHLGLYATDHGQDARATSEQHIDKGNSQRCRTLLCRRGRLRYNALERGLSVNGSAGVLAFTYKTSCLCLQKPAGKAQRVPFVFGFDFAWVRLVVILGGGE